MLARFLALRRLTSIHWRRLRKDEETSLFQTVPEKRAKIAMRATHMAWPRIAVEKMAETLGSSKVKLPSPAGKRVDPGRGRGKDMVSFDITPSHQRWPTITHNDDKRRKKRRCVVCRRRYRTNTKYLRKGVSNNTVGC